MLRTQLNIDMFLAPDLNTTTSGATDVYVRGDWHKIAMPRLQMKLAGAVGNLLARSCL